MAEVHDTHPDGKAITVKDAAFYEDPATQLFLAPDDSAGVAVTGEGDLVSVVNMPPANAAEPFWLALRNAVGFKRPSG